MYWPDDGKVKSRTSIHLGNDSGNNKVPKGVTVWLGENKRQHLKMVGARSTFKKSEQNLKGHFKMNFFYK